MATNDVTTSTGTGEASANPVDQIAGLLGALGAGDPEKEEQEEIELPEGQEAEEKDEGEEGEGEEKEEKEETDVTWAAVLGLDEKQTVLDEEGNFAGISIKVDGKVDVVDIPTLVKGFQDNKSNTVKSQQLAEERKQLAEEKQTVLLTYKQKVQDAEALTKYLEGTINRDFQGIDWNALRASDPAEYSAAVTDYNLRMQEIEKIKSAISTVNEEETKKWQQENAQRNNEYVQQQIRLAVERNPEWGKPEVFVKALKSMSEFMSETYGISTQEFAEIKDARVLEVIKDAQKYRTGAKVAEQKLAKPIVKMVKQTGSRQAGPSKLDRLVKQAKNATGYQKAKIQTDAIAELLAGKG